MTADRVLEEVMVTAEHKPVQKEEATIRLMMTADHVLKEEVLATDIYLRC